MFNKEVYVVRRKALTAKMASETGIIIFLGNVESPAQYRDNCYKWRQDSNWLYFFGIDEPGYSAIIDLESGNETVYADDFSLDDIIWMGPTPSVASQAARAGVQNSAAAATFDAEVRKALAAGRKVHFLPASRYWNAGKFASLLGGTMEEYFSAGKKGCAKASRALVDAVVSLRLVKEDIEIAELDAIGAVGYEMHSEARRNIKTGLIEQTAVGAMEGVVLKQGWGVSFPTILTQHGEIFHCHSHECVIEPGRLMVVDAGAESNSHYASDHTRTYPTGGKFTPRQRDIYQIVYEANELAFSLVKPETKYLDVHNAACKHILEGLKALDIVRGDVEEMVPLGIAGLFMPHGLGHNMGLDVHDMEDLGEDLVGYDADQKRSPLLGLGSLRMARRLKPGNVITDEPGIYFIPDLIRSWKQEGTDKGFVNYSKLETYFDFGGIRLEDDVLVTTDGARRIGSKRLPIAPEDVEEAMAND